MWKRLLWIVLLWLVSLAMAGSCDFRHIGSFTSQTCTATVVLGQGGVADREYRWSLPSGWVITDVSLNSLYLVAEETTENSPSWRNAVATQFAALNTQINVLKTAMTRPTLRDSAGTLDLMFRLVKAQGALQDNPRRSLILNRCYLGCFNKGQARIQAMWVGVIVPPQLDKDIRNVMQRPTVSMSNSCDQPFAGKVALVADSGERLRVDYRSFSFSGVGNQNWGARPLEWFENQQIYIAANALEGYQLSSPQMVQPQQKLTLTLDGRSTVFFRLRSGNIQITCTKK